VVLGVAAGEGARGSWDLGEVKGSPGEGAGAYDCFTKKDVFVSRHAACRRRNGCHAAGGGAPRQLGFG